MLCSWYSIAQYRLLGCLDRHGIVGLVISYMPAGISLFCVLLYEKKSMMMPYFDNVLEG
jgi:hypothetical protein